MYCLHSLKWQLHNSEEEISNGYSDLHFTDNTSLKASLALLVLHVMRYNNQLHKRKRRKKKRTVSHCQNICVSYF